MTSWTFADSVLLRAAIDRIFPRDRDPSATDLGVDRYILAQLQTGAVMDAEPIRSGLRGLAAEAVARHGRALPELGPDEQDGLLRGVEEAPWFRALVELTAEGVYADPGNGGNAEARSWAMIGYEHRLPEGPSGPPGHPADRTTRSRTGDVPDDMEAERPVETARGVHEGEAGRPVETAQQGADRR